MPRGAAGDAVSTDLAFRRAVVWSARGLTYLVYAYVLLNEVILALGFVLRLFAANPQVAFAAWVYRDLGHVMAPFRGIFTTVDLGPTTATATSVLDTSIVFAMVVYAVLGLALHHLIDWLAGRIAILDHAESRVLAQARGTATAPVDDPDRTLTEVIGSPPDRAHVPVAQPFPPSAAGSDGASAGGSGTRVSTPGSR